MPEAAAIPIIDISAEGADELQIARALVDAAAEFGFVYIKNTGKEIPVEQIENAFAVSRTLFTATPLEEKQKCTIQTNNRGWSGMHTETLDPKTQRVGDFKEAFNFGPFTGPDGEADQPLPATLATQQAEIRAFREACHALCRRLLHLFGVGLAVDPPDFFEAAHPPEGPSGTILRLLYYPAPAATTTTTTMTEKEEESRRGDDVRAGAHSDYGSITLLFRLRGQAGLEVLAPTTPGVASASATGDDDQPKFRWAPVPVVPPGTEDDAGPPILVNIGDLLSYWTNGLLRSTVHRVAFTEGGSSTTSSSAGVVPGESSTDPRYSIAFFCHPADKTRLTAVPSERVRQFRGSLGDASEGNPYAERKVLTADEHLKMRLQASYLQMYEKKEGEVAA